MSAPNQYDPQSTDAMFAQILANQESDRRERAEFRSEMRDGMKAHGRRLGALEIFTANLKGRIAAYGTLAGGAGVGLIEWIKHTWGAGGGGAPGS